MTRRSHRPRASEDRLPRHLRVRRDGAPATGRQPAPAGARGHPARQPPGRGRRLVPPPAAETARELGLALHQTADVNSPESVEAIRAAGPEAIAVCAFGQLIKEPLLSEWTMLNVHPSLMPRWRGAAPIERALMAGDGKTGVTIMRVTEGLDSGPVALAEEVEISRDDDYAVALGEARRAGGRAGRARPRRPRGAASSSSPSRTRPRRPTRRRSRRTSADWTPRSARWSSSGRARALTPHIGAYLELEDGSRLGVRSAEAGSVYGPGIRPPGTLDCEGEPRARLRRRQPPRWTWFSRPGKKPMSAADFLRGHHPPQKAL